jgi:hypothetical protein
LTAGVAGVHGFVGDVPRAAVNDQSRLHMHLDSAEDEDGLNKEVENDQEWTEKEEKRAPTKTAARHAAQRASQMGRSGLEPGFLARAVEGSYGLVAREIPAKGAGFFIEPEENVVAPAPKDDHADDKGEVAEKS